MIRAILLALALLGSAALAQETKPLPDPPQQKRPANAEQKKPLSAEDQALVKELPLLENVELLEDLDLFEGKEQAEAPKDPPRRQP
jgi:hypothetical protein